MCQNKKHILVVDDDTRLRALLQRFLREKGFMVSGAKDAADARLLLQNYRFDLLILDVMMPDESGLDFLESLRLENDTPVIMLTAMGETGDRIAGLEKGADDYIAKPFEPQELVLRIQNILKRTPRPETLSQTLDLDLCLYDTLKKELYHKKGGLIHLTPVEQALLYALAEKAGQTLSRESLAETLGGDQSPRSIDVQITRLRKKIEYDPKNPRFLQTVRGKGYRLLSKEN